MNVLEWRYKLKPLSLRRLISKSDQTWFYIEEQNNYADMNYSKKLKDEIILFQIFLFFF